MISPHSAPPGTVVICVDAKGNTALGFRSPIVEGAHYTVAEWSDADLVGLIEVRESAPGVRVAFAPRRFRLPVTLESLQSLSCDSPPELDKGAPKPARRRVRA